MAGLRRRDDCRLLDKGPLIIKCGCRNHILDKVHEISLFAVSLLKSDVLHVI